MDNNAINRYIVGETGGEEAENIIKNLAQSIESDQARLVDLVQLLGDYLTEDEGEIRAKATLCLASTLCQLSSDKLTKQQINVIVSFLCDRVQDEDCLKEVAMGLQAVIKMYHFSPLTNLDLILDTLNENVSMKRHVQNTRYQVFLLLNGLLDYQQKTQPKKLISTYVNLTTGEKDPRNLLISFQISNRILSSMEIKDSVEDLFDVTFCYFPITFEPPKNDPYGITSNDLKTALRRSISANPLFASDVFPGLIEKLNSSSESVKIDSLETISACINNYTLDSIISNWQEIWDGIKYEVLHQGEDDHDIPRHAMRVLATLGERLAQDNGALDLYLDAVERETKEKLQDPQSKFSIPAAKLCGCVASSSDVAFSRIAEFVLKIEFTHLNEQTPNIAAQRGILEILCIILTSSKQVIGTGSGGLLLKLNENYKDHILDLFSKSLMGSAKTEITLKTVAIRGLAIICSLHDFVDENEIGLLVQYLGTTVLEEENEELTTNALVVLRTISWDYPNVILNVIFPSFFSQLPDSEDDSDAKTSARKSGSIDFILSALASLSASRPIFESLCIRLLAKLKAIHQCTFKYPLAIVSTLLAVTHKLAEEAKDNDEFLASYFYTLTPPLFNAVVSANDSNPMRHDSVINAVGELSSVLVSKNTSDVQNKILEDLFNLFVWSKPSSFLFEGTLPSFSEPTNIHQLFLMTLAPISNTNQNVNITPIQLMETCIELLGKTENIFERAAYLRILTLLTNKWINDSNEISALIGFDKLDKNTMEIQAYIAKGLVMKNDRLGLQLVEKIVMLLNDPTLGSYAGKVFGVFVYDDHILSKENGLVMRLLYKQKLFSMVLPKLIDGFKVGDNQQANYLIALAGMLRYMPSKIILPVLPQFLPLLLESLGVPDGKVQEAAIDTILATLIDSTDILEQHINTIVPKLLQASTSAKGPNVRISALKCLAALPTAIARPTLQPFQRMVIQELEPVLGDKKRQVRKEAVVCRQMYYEM